MNDAHDDDPFGHPLAWDALVALFYTPVILGSMLWILVYGGKVVLWHRLLGDDPLRGAAIGAVVGLALVITSRLSTRVALGARAVAAFQRMLVDVGPWSCLWLALFSAFGEELFFRGVLQPRMGMVGASALFALAHVPLERAMWPWPVMAFGGGLVFGWLYTLDDAILAPGVAHFVLNLLNLLWLTTRERVVDQ